MISGKNMREVEKAEYLGDTFNRLGNNWDLIESRVNKGQSCLVNAMSLCGDVTLGVYSIQTLLLLYRSMFIPVVLYNAQAWANIIEKQMEALRTIQLKFIKRIFHSPSSTPNALTFLETGILPIEKVINIKQLTFLYHILTLGDDDPVKINYVEQTKYKFECNWGNEVKQIRKLYEINNSDREVSSMSKEKWKELVKRKVTSYALNELNKKIEEVKHSGNLAPYNKLKPQPYIQTLLPSQARIIFQIRTRVIDLKGVRKYQYENTLCRLCGDMDENIHHVVNKCAMVTKTCYVNPFSNDENEMEEIAKRYMEFSTKVEKLNAKK